MSYMEKGKYQFYNAEMFVEDPAFRRWVKDKSLSDQLFWREFLGRYPDQKGEVDRAISILDALNAYYSEEHSAGEIERSFSKVKQGIQQ